MKESLVIERIFNIGSRSDLNTWSRRYKMAGVHLNLAMKLDVGSRLRSHAGVWPQDLKPSRTSTRVRLRSAKKEAR
jgi:hypothetical protein